MTAAATATTEERRFRMTYQEWLSSAAESRRVEWAHGEAIEFVLPTVRHQDVTAFLLSLLRPFAGLRGLGMVLSSPLEVRLSAHSSGEPAPSRPGVGGGPRARRGWPLWIARVGRRRMVPVAGRQGVPMATRVVADRSVAGPAGLPRRNRGREDLTTPAVCWLGVFHKAPVSADTRSNRRCLDVGPGTAPDRRSHRGNCWRTLGLLP